MRTAALQEGLKATGDIFSAAADLLSQDEKSKKKHAGVVKALQIANIQVNLAAEVSGIFANAQKSAIAQLLGPVAGNILATIQAAAATLRAGVASAKVQSTKFARGTLMDFAKIGFFGGRPHSQGGTKGYFDDGTAIEVERDEAFAVVNKRNAPLLRMLSNINAIGGHGVPFFAQGGLPNINTTPVSQPAISGSAAVELSNIATFVDAVNYFSQVVAAFPRQVSAEVSYLKLEDAGDRLNTVRDDAAI